MDSGVQSEEEKRMQQDLMSIVDTTLLICYVENKSDILTSFVRVKNHCELPESEKVLKVSSARVVSLLLPLDMQFPS